MMSVWFMRRRRLLKRFDAKTSGQFNYAKNFYCKPKLLAVVLRRNVRLAAQPARQLERSADQSRLAGDHCVSALDVHSRAPQPRMDLGDFYFHWLRHWHVLVFFFR